MKLKVKIKTLTAEARIIRADERKQKKWAAKAKARNLESFASRHLAARDSLQNHRRTVVRSEARHSLLAYGFLRGTPYAAMEMKCHEQPDWDRVLKMAERFGGRGNLHNEFLMWSSRRQDAA